MYRNRKKFYIVQQKNIVNLVVKYKYFVSEIICNLVDTCTLYTGKILYI